MTSTHFNDREIAAAARGAMLQHGEWCACTYCMPDLEPEDRLAAEKRCKALEMDAHKKRKLAVERLLAKS